MLLRDQMEPLARYIVNCLVQNGAVPGSAWRNYTCPAPKADGRIDAVLGDLLPLKQTKDNEVGYVWGENHEARIILQNITFEDVDPNNFDMSKRIVLASKLKATDVIPFVNGTTEVQEATVEHWEEVGENEINAIKAGFEKKTTVSAEASGGIKGIGEAKASVVDETTLSAAFERTTGRKISKRSGGVFLFRQPPMTEGEARLTWSEQTMQTRVEGFKLIRCKIVLGRYHRYRKYNSRKARKTWRESWTSGSPIVFSDVSEIIAIMRKMGSVHTPYFEHFAKASSKPDPAYADNLERMLRQDVNFVTEPFKGANEFKPEIVTSQSMIEEEGSDEGEDEAPG